MVQMHARSIQISEAREPIEDRYGNRADVVAWLN